jgi:UDP-N-acetylmuramoyl-tripeptide--D-alanyl-D-alanine ligase
MTNDKLHALFRECSGASTDTRTVSPGSMFFALKGPNFNANALAPEALAKGARYAIIDDPSAQRDGTILVPDVLAALQGVALEHRRKHQIPVIGITGSNGKTTTKELVHVVLSADRSTLATVGNLNNHIGVPLTLLNLRSEHRAAIVEMGANKPGDIAELCAIAEPTHGLITNIGKAHLEGFGGFDGVLRTKTELYGSIQSRDGLLFVNADDRLLMDRSDGIKRCTYGTSEMAETRGETVRGDHVYLHFGFAGIDGRRREVRTRMVGGYNLPNALAAIAIGQHFGVDDDRIAEALAGYSPSNNRSQLLETGRNVLVMDAYNANPTSMVAALENLASMETRQPRMAILGDMLELGKSAPEEHQRIVELARRLGLHCLFVGPIFSACAPKGSASANADEMKAMLESQSITGHLILVKGSRGVGLERVVPVL